MTAMKPTVSKRRKTMVARNWLNELSCKVKLNITMSTTYAIAASHPCHTPGVHPYPYTYLFFLEPIPSSHGFILLPYDRESTYAVAGRVTWLLVALPEIERKAVIGKLL